MPTTQGVYRRFICGPYQHALRLRARSRRIEPGATVVTVNFNTLPFLKTLVSAVQRYSPDWLQLLVMDNASTDGSIEWMQQVGVRYHTFSYNVYHPTALDIGFLLAKTEFAIALDIDAFPITDAWVDTLLNPLRAGKVVSGAYNPITHVREPYVHPCCLAMRTADFARRGHSFVEPGVPPGQHGQKDVGVEISLKEQGRLHLLVPTEVRGPGPVGSVFGGVVYHNFYATRFMDPDTALADTYVHRTDPELAWSEAVERFLR
jgi:glycosyltransferase involved in cell wall biosynthesis